MVETILLAESENTDTDSENSTDTQVRKADGMNWEMGLKYI